MLVALTFLILHDILYIINLISVMFFFFLFKVFAPALQKMLFEMFEKHKAYFYICSHIQKNSVDLIETLEKIHIQPQRHKQHDNTLPNVYVQLVRKLISQKLDVQKRQRFMLNCMVLLILLRATLFNRFNIW